MPCELKFHHNFHLQPQIVQRLRDGCNNLSMTGQGAFAIRQRQNILDFCPRPPSSAFSVLFVIRLQNHALLTLAPQCRRLMYIPPKPLSLAFSPTPSVTFHTPTVTHPIHSLFYPSAKNSCLKW